MHTSQQEGDCRRFPKKERKYNDDWCGEFRKQKEENNYED